MESRQGTLELPLEGESLMTFKALARLTAGDVSYESLRRWARLGINGVYLEQRRIGGRFFSSTEAMRRFLAKTQG